MASTSEIRRRIGSVRQTQKITHAMYLISQAKLQQGQGGSEHTVPTSTHCRRRRPRVQRRRHRGEPVSRDENSKPLPGVAACLLITADKGLAGAYNQNAIRQAQKFLAANEGAELYVVGEYAAAGSPSGASPSKRAFSTPRRTPPCAVPARSASCCWSGTTPLPSTLSTSSTRT